MTLHDIIFAKKDTIGIITLQRHKALNALTHAMTLAINQQLIVWKEDPEINAVLIHSSGGRAFCAGGDIREIYHSSKAKAKQFFHNEYAVNQLIFDYPKPYIALMNGITMGGGAGIALHGKYRIASELWAFAMPETGIGFFPDIGASYFLSRCPKQTGIYLGLTGLSIGADDAFALGLIDAIIPSVSHIPFIHALIATSRLTAKHIQSCIERFQIKPKPMAPIKERMPLIAQIFAKRSIEAIMHALMQQADPWCHALSERLLQRSPTSLKITLRQLHLGRKLSFKQCMALEYRLAGYFLEHPDFFEGIRAAIIDKDKQPRWQPASLADVPEDSIDALFKNPLS